MRNGYAEYISDFVKEITNDVFKVIDSIAQKGGEAKNSKKIVKNGRAGYSMVGHEKLLLSTNKGQN